MMYALNKFYLNPSDFAKRLGVNQKTVWVYVKSGKVDAFVYRKGRNILFILIPVKELKKMIARKNARKKQAKKNGSINGSLSGRSLCEEAARKKEGVANGKENGSLLCG